jgi:MAP3K TRAFs-binding domain
VSQPPLCFVVMPFGLKPDANRQIVDFDSVYEELLEPAIRAADLEPLRADHELVGGVIHKPMYERLILADYAVADLTTANANVFYEIGVRHALRPYSTVLVSADVKRVPFDLAPDRVLPYRLDGAGRPSEPDRDCQILVKALRAAREANTDSPVFQLIGDLPRVDIDRLKTDVFRDRVAYSVSAKEELARHRAAADAGAVRAFEKTLGPLDDVEAGVLVDVLLSYRATEAWADMVRFVESMPEPLRRTLLVREQYGFALNRDHRPDDAERELLAILDDHGPSGETLGLLGRVYKDRWEAARESSILKARGYLEKAIDAHRRGFECDWRSAYPGVNAVTLLEIRGPGDPVQAELLPVVHYACMRRIAAGAADYWDHATRLELGVVTRDRDEAFAGATAALAAVREKWEPKSTAHNLSLIREARAERDDRIDWADEIENELLEAAGVPQATGKRT